MKLTYKKFGAVAFMDRYTREKLAGDEIVIACNMEDGTKLCLWGADKKKRRDYIFANGEAVVPVAAFDEAEYSVSFEEKDGTTAIGNPLHVIQIGGDRYLIENGFTPEEEIRRLRDALIYEESRVEKALSVAKEALSMSETVKWLKKRAESGDIIKF